MGTSKLHKKDFDAMRLDLMNAYPDNLGWHDKVSKMPYRQVIAIHNKLKNDKKLGSKPKEAYHQMTIWEYLTEMDILKEENKDGLAVTN